MLESQLFFFIFIFQIIQKDKLQKTLLLEMDFHIDLSL